MAVYSATFAAVSSTNARDVFQIVAPADGKVAILGVNLAQYSDAGDAEAEILSVQFIRGSTASGSGGAANTPSNMHGHTGALTASSSVGTNHTTVASTGNILLATAWNVQVPFDYRASVYQDEIITLAPSQRFVVRLTAPADAVTLNGTLIFEELFN